MTDKKHSLLQVLLLFSQNNKPDRDRLAGFLHYKASRLEPWDIRTVDGSSPTLYDDCRHACAGWPADAIIFSDYALLQSLQHRFSNLRRAKYRIGIDAHLTRRRVPGTHLISLDNGLLVDSALDLFTRRGYRNFAFFGADHPGESIYSRDVERVFRSRVNARQISPISFRLGLRKGLSATLTDISRWVQTLPKPCGILAYSDDIAQHLLISCQLSNILVPQQISVIGVDNNIDICETCHPTLTSILPDFEQSGFLAGRLLSNLTSSTTKARTSPARISYGIREIHERDSTQDWQNAGRLTRSVLNIIQKEGLGDLTVSQLSRRLGSSTRLLERHFKSVTGTTIRAELLRFRCMRLRERILSKNQSLGELSLSCGFRTVNAAQIAFRKVFGQSMREYRGRFNATKH